MRGVAQRAGESGVEVCEERLDLVSRECVDKKNYTKLLLVDVRQRG